MLHTRQKPYMVLYCVIFHIFVIISQSHGFHGDEILLDSKQADYVSNLKDYVVSLPSRVDEKGGFLGHELHVHLIKKRSVGEGGVGTGDSDVIHYKIPIGNNNIVIQVRENKRLYTPATVVERRKNKFKNVSDSKFSDLKVQGCHYTGHVVGQENSKVAIAACGGLTGLLHTETDQYFIEPFQGHDWQRNPKHPHIVYKRSSLPPHWDILHSADHVHNTQQHGSCGVKDATRKALKQRERWESHHRNHSSYPHNPEKHPHRKKRSISTEKYVETFIAVDPVMTNYYKNEDLENYVLTVMNMVATLFHDATIGNAVNIVIVRIMILEDDQDDLIITHHADNSLRSFCKWQKTINVPGEDSHNHHDVALLLTRHNICSRMNEPCSTLGLAQVAGLCQSHRSCNINEDTGLALAFTITHELGHNFAMKHDLQNTECESTEDEQYIMAPHLVADSTPLKWSNCSRAAITKFLDRDWGFCLDDEPEFQLQKFKYPAKPPGIMYDADHQCRLLYDDNAALCEEIEENICHTMWCRVNNKCSTKLQAAAEGTICGINKWCYGGTCVEIGERPDAIDGEWGQWGSWSSCTRTCGAGISLSQRHCENPQPSNGGKYCLGERKRYKICNTGPCPENSRNFRAHQCAEFNKIPYKNGLHEWTPISTPNKPCQLHCKPKNKFFSVMLKDTVTDGTPCSPGTRSMCISGRCRHVGCDWVIESTAVEDICGVCYGDGSTCKTIKHQFNFTERLGYVEAAVIPTGARNIRVEEVAEANNFLALKNDNDEYYLNGHWFIQWSGDYEVAGTVVHYIRTGNSKEKFMAPGPIKEPLHVMLLLQTDNQGIEFEYTVPKENATDLSLPEFSWHFTSLSHCTVSCGGGIKRSRVVCTEKEAGVVDDMYCNKTTKPDDKSKPCNEHLCPPMWWTGPWQRCSVTCGPGGMHRRTVICVRSIKPDEQMALEDKKCEGLNKPTEVEPCHHKESCPGFTKWIVGKWSSCNSNPCIKKHRKVECDSPTVGCDMMKKPAAALPCSNITCGEWLITDWSNCSVDCGGGLQTRDVMCEGSDVCNMDIQPANQQLCNNETCPEETTGSSDENKANNLNESVYKNTIESNTGDTNVNEEIKNALKILNGEEKPLEMGSESVLIGLESEELEPELKHTTAPPTYQKHRHHHGEDKHRHTSEKPSNSLVVPDDATGDITPPELFGIKEGGDYTQEEESEEKDFEDPNFVEYSWKTGAWSECSNKCGSGTRTRSISCIETVSHVPVSTHHCKGLEKPESEKRCVLEPCLNWQVTDWGQCSATCGYAVKSRHVRCPVEGRCDPGEKPAAVEECKLQSCLAWVSGDWSTCSKSCDGGVQERLVKCVNLTSLLSSAGCNRGYKPAEEQKCNRDSCPTQTGALTVRCATKEMSHRVCRMLKRLNHCSKPYVLVKCCRTCGKHHREKTQPKYTAR